MASEILVCPKCSERALAVVLANEGLKDKCTKCGTKYVVEKTPTLPKAVEVEAD